MVRSSPADDSVRRRPLMCRTASVRDNFDPQDRSTCAASGETRPEGKIEPRGPQRRSSTARELAQSPVRLAPLAAVPFLGVRSRVAEPCNLTARQAARRLMRHPRSLSASSLPAAISRRRHARDSIERAAACGNRETASWKDWGFSDRGAQASLDSRASCRRVMVESCELHRRAFRFVGNPSAPSRVGLDRPERTCPVLDRPWNIERSTRS